MSNERQVAKKGFGTTMINHLKEVDFASTDDLAKLAGVTTEQAYSRLMFLQSQEKLVISVGRGSAKVWSMADKAPPPAPVVENSKEEGINGLFNKNHGWKPSLRRFQPLTELPKVGDRLLVEYPDSWRDSVLVLVSREVNDQGAVSCWDLRNTMYCYVPVTQAAMEKYNVKVVSVSTEKDVNALIGEK